jgi:hypothetical protein
LSVVFVFVFVFVFNLHRRRRRMEMGREKEKEKETEHLDILLIPTCFSCCWNLTSSHGRSVTGTMSTALRPRRAPWWFVI